MKIGLFGDSFACKQMRTHKRYEGHPGFTKIGKPWFEYLPYKIISFGASGSDLYYSYNLYLENYSFAFKENTILKLTSWPFKSRSLPASSLNLNSRRLRLCFEQSSRSSELLMQSLIISPNFAFWVCAFLTTVLPVEAVQCHKCSKVWASD